jgi:hypothetical protein
LADDAICIARSLRQPAPIQCSGGGGVSPAAKRPSAPAAGRFGLALRGRRAAAAARLRRLARLRGLALLGRRGLLGTAPAPAALAGLRGRGWRRRRGALGLGDGRGARGHGGQGGKQRTAIEIHGVPPGITGAHYRAPRESLHEFLSMDGRARPR